MKLRTKGILFCAGSALLMTAPLGGVASRRLSEDRIGTLQEDMARQLQRVDVALGVFLAERASDRNHLAANPAVCSRENARFTGFLGADESAFRYDMQPLEQRRIGISPSYETTHPPSTRCTWAGRTAALSAPLSPNAPRPATPENGPGIGSPTSFCNTRTDWTDQAIPRACTKRPFFPRRGSSLRQTWWKRWPPLDPAVRPGASMRQGRGSRRTTARFATRLSRTPVCGCFAKSSPFF